MSAPELAWIEIARSLIGTREIRGNRHNPKVLEMFAAIGNPGVKDDETPWCAAFVGYCLQMAKQKGSGKLNARSYLGLGTPLNEPAYGCTVVLHRGDPKGWSGHVGFVVGRDVKGRIMILGGNQSDAVTIAPFDSKRVLGYRWPTGKLPLPERYNLPVIDSQSTLSTNER